MQKRSLLTPEFCPQCGTWDFCILEPGQAGNARLSPVATGAGTIDRLAMTSLPCKLNPVASRAAPAGAQPADGLSELGKGHVGLTSWA